MILKILDLRTEIVTCWNLAVAESTHVELTWLNVFLQMLMAQLNDSTSLMQAQNIILLYGIKALKEYIPDCISGYLGLIKGVW